MDGSPIAHPSRKDLDELQLSLDVALRNCAQYRDETLIAQQETMETLGRTQWPNQAASVAARALVVRMSRSAARLRKATERLEQDARNSHFAHVAEAQAAVDRTHYVRTVLTAQQQVAEATLTEEIRSSEEEFASFTRAALAQSKVKAAFGDALHTHRESAAHRETRSGLTGVIAKLQVDLAEASDRARKSELHVSALQKANSRLAAEREDDAARHKEELAQMQRRIVIQDEELVNNAAARGLLRGELERTQEAAEETDRATRRSFEVSEDMRIAEAKRLQREIDRMRAVRSKALDVGSYKGRTIHYLDSLRPPPPRAHDQPSLERALTRSALSWRDSQACDGLLQEILASVGPDMREPFL